MSDRGLFEFVVSLFLTKCGQDDSSWQDDSSQQDDSSWWVEMTDLMIFGFVKEFTMSCTLGCAHFGKADLTVRSAETS